MLSKAFSFSAKSAAACSQSPLDYYLNPKNALTRISSILAQQLPQSPGKKHLSKTPNSIRFKNMEFSFETMSLRCLPDGTPESLPLKEARILGVLLQDPAKIWTRRELQEAVWDRLKVSPRTIDSHISRLRKKLQYTGVSIESRYGGGYTLE